jgi:hypothetical protein
MKKLPRIVSAEPVMDGVLKLAFSDGYVGVVDLRPLIAEGDVFDWLRQTGNFSKFAMDEFGHSISWVDASGYVIDFGADSLRRDCERQAAMHRLMTA